MSTSADRRRWRYANDPEYRARVDAQQAAYRQANRVTINARDRARYAADPEGHRTRAQARRDADPAKIAEQNRVRGQRRDRAKDAARHTQSRHGISPEGWAALWAAQGGRCYLCGDELTRSARRNTAGHPVVDHVHDHRHEGGFLSCPACRRGLACSPCNLLIGWAKDDPARLCRIADNLAAANRAARQRIDALAG